MSSRPLAALTPLFSSTTPMRPALAPLFGQDATSDGVATLAGAWQAERELWKMLATLLCQEQTDRSRVGRLLREQGLLPA